MSKNSNHQQRMMKKLKKAFSYTEYMVNAADKINGGRKHRVTIFNPLFSSFGEQMVSNEELYESLRKGDDFPDNYWEIVTEDWTSKEWTELAKQRFLWVARNV